MIRRLVMACCLAAPCVAQFLPSLQAKSREEFDAYLTAVGAPSPHTLVEAAARFAARWPESELTVRVCELQLEAYRKLGDAAAALAAGERGLRAAPGYPPLLVEAAAIEANATTDRSRLEKARARAREALERIEAASAPRDMRPEAWEQAVARLSSRAWAASGLAAFKLGRDSEAIAEFERALALHPPPADPSQQYRLALLYRASGRATEARRLLEQVARCGDAAFEKMARAALGR
ncbi:MAG: tetratricopeptide repeat protein [Bryobacteraceae bacterium]